MDKPLILDEAEPVGWSAEDLADWRAERREASSEYSNWIFLNRENESDVTEAEWRFLDTQVPPGPTIH